MSVPSINDRYVYNRHLQTGQSIFDGSGEFILFHRDAVVERNMITSAQCRAARALLDWSQQALAEAASVGVVTIRQFEGGSSEPRHSTRDVISRALEAAGVEFIPENGGGPGVRIRKTSGPQQ